MADRDRDRDRSEALDLLVLGSGVAGLSAAVRAASAAGRGLRVGVLTKGRLEQATTRWAQGGVAAVLGGDPDSTDLHLADTLKAGAGLCDPDAVRVLVDEGPARVNELIAWGAVFDREAGGALALAREGGHSVARVVHAGGAATGAEIERALVAAVKATAASVMEDWFAVDFLVEEDGECAGVSALDPSGEWEVVRARHVLLATGGAGQLYAVTTNPPEATGDGMAMALRAHVPVADVEFMQFHPTALHHPSMPRPLLSEALRGHGALLRDATGERFVDELLPRDVVSRAMAARMGEQGVEHLWLDATGLEDFDRRFPTIAASMRSAGLDPSSEWLPVAPAAHYTMGGVLTDLDGATGMPGLWAAGESACSGVHGANRLGSNSLLEGMVFGARVVEAILAGKRGSEPTGVMRDAGCPARPSRSGHAGQPLRSGHAGQPLRSGHAGQPLRSGHAGQPLRSGHAGQPLRSGHAGQPLRSGHAGQPLPDGAVEDDGDRPLTGVAAGDPAKLRETLQQAMTLYAGVRRDAGSLAEAARQVAAVAGVLPERGRHALELRNLVWVADALVGSATVREESRGAHTRADFPETSPEFACRIVHR